MKSKEEILSNMNWKKIHKVMTFLNWKWFICPKTYRIPTIYELIKKAEELIDQATEEAYKYKKNAFFATGGFEAECIWNDSLSLRFVLDSFMAEEEDV